MAKGPTHNANFTCLIADSRFGESYSADVRIAKKTPIRRSLQLGRIDLADIYITPISSGSRIVHDHFVLYDAAGNGLHIVRDPSGREVRRTLCNIWDLGPSFARQVQRHLKTLS
jgi:hypothetical protein